LSRDTNSCTLYFIAGAELNILEDCAVIVLFGRGT
jgi:hypothetical protein